MGNSINTAGLLTTLCGFLGETTGQNIHSMVDLNFSEHDPLAGPWGNKQSNNLVEKLEQRNA
jgi:hypothetical protein